MMLTHIFDRECMRFVCCVSYIALLLILLTFTCLFSVVLFHSVNCLGGCAAWGEEQNVFKICLLTASHEYDLATDEQNVHN